MKINLHAHTIYSDGHNSIKEMALKAQECGHVALVLTDHDYCFFRDLDTEIPLEEPPECKFLRECAEAEIISKKLNFPIFVGMEISLYIEEAILFGREAILEFLKERDNIIDCFKNKQIPEFNFRKHKHALIVVHPGIGHKAAQYAEILSAYDVFHGYEIMNHGVLWKPEAVSEMARIMPKAKQFKGLDAHGVMIFERHPECCNAINKALLTEDELIDWIVKCP